MGATENRPASRNEPGEVPGNEVPPTPDEDGPHDVPDEKVIEKTLPSTPRPGRGGNS